MITTFESGRSRRIIRVASRPFMRGIETSIRITWGWRAFAFSTASTPSRASPHTCQLLRDKSKEPRPRRTVASSSTTRMRKESNGFDSSSHQFPRQRPGNSSVRQGKSLFKGRFESHTGFAVWPWRGRPAHSLKEAKRLYKGTVGGGFVPTGFVIKAKRNFCSFVPDSMDR